MKAKKLLFISLFSAVIFIFSFTLFSFKHRPAGAVAKHYLYVAVPGIRDYPGYGGHGILVFDMDNNHRFVKRTATKGFHPDNTPSNVKGVALRYIQLKQHFYQQKDRKSCILFFDLWPLSPVVFRTEVSV